MNPRQVTILQGRTFMVSDERGDVDVDYGVPDGLFYRDTRHLSRWQLRLGGRPLESLAADAVEYDEAVIYLEEPTGTVYRNATVSILRHRWIGDGLKESIEVTNHDSEPVRLQVELLFDADFADIFEVKDKTRKIGRAYHRVGEDHTLLGYERDGFRRETVI